MWERIEENRKMPDPYSAKLTSVQELAHCFAWAIPNQQALEIIHSYGPIVEMGAGTGYWARMLQDMGTDIIPYDYRPPDMAGKRDSQGFLMEQNIYCTTQYTDVLEGMPDILSQHQDRSLFLCWPPVGKMANDCLNHWFKGQYLIYVGEFDSETGGCTANHIFCARLEREFALIQRCQIPTWPGHSDELMVWERNGRARARRSN